MLAKGVYRGRAVRGLLSETKTGTMQVAVEFDVELGDGEVQRHPWYGFLTEKTLKRTIESLRACGWRGDDLTDLSGIDAEEVELVVQHEEYDGAMRARIAWVNAPGAVQFAQPLSEGKARAFAAQMRGKIAALRATAPAANGSVKAQGNKRVEPPAHSDSDAPPF